VRGGQIYNERWPKARPYSYAMLFVFFVPGLMLSFVHDVKLLPTTIVRFLYPYSILPWEKAFVTEVPSRMHAVGVTAADLSNPSILNEQSVVVALVSFFLVFLVVGLQTWADALFADQPLKVLPTALLMLPVGLLLRCYSLFLLFEHADAVGFQQPTQWVVSQANHFLAPVGFVLSTCLVAKTIHVIGRIAYLYLAGRYVS
jgi:hypothetical protein